MLRFLFEKIKKILKPSRFKSQSVFAIIVIILFGIIVFNKIGSLTFQVRDLTINIEQNTGLFIIFTLVNVFPITAIAYVLFHGNTQKRKLARSFWLLGIQVEGDLDEESREQIKTNINKSI